MHSEFAWPPAECADWLAREQRAAAAEAEQCRTEVARALVSLARRYVDALKGGAMHRQGAGFSRRRGAKTAWKGRPTTTMADEARIEAYTRRLWHCVEYHWRRWSDGRPLTFATVVGRLEAGDLGVATKATNVLFEVVLAQSLELGEQQAAKMFESDYMPTVRAVARHLGGQRAVEAVDNFAAELVLPRDGRPPRIASFQGRTPLASWLRAVVANFWISETRKRQAVNVAVLPEIAMHDGDVAAAMDARPCEELLRPVFGDASRPLTSEDRLLVKMLLLDGVGQNELARAFGVHSGTLTRRRQRAMAVVLDHVRELVERHASPRQARHCLELVLAGDDANLRRRLAAVLAAGIQGDDTIGMEVDEHV